jgi:hypothetical protein
LAADKLEADEALKAQQDVTAIQAQATTVTGQIPGYQTKLDYIKQLHTVPGDILNVYRQIFPYTSPKVYYSNYAYSAGSIQLTAYAPSLPELARYMQIMYNCPIVTGLSVSAIPNINSMYTPSVHSYSVPALPAPYSAHYPGSKVAISNYTITNGVVTEINGLGPNNPAQETTALGVGGQMGGRPMMGPMGGGAGPQMGGGTMGRVGGGPGMAGGGQATAIPYKPSMGFDFNVTLTTTAELKTVDVPTDLVFSGGSAQGTGMGRGGPGMGGPGMGGPRMGPGAGARGGPPAGGGGD